MGVDVSRGSAVPIRPVFDFTCTCFHGYHAACGGWRRVPGSPERAPCLCACHARVVAAVGGAR